MRQKKNIITGVTREAAEEAFALYAKSDAQLRKCSAEIELQCARIRQKYQERLAALTQDRDQAFAVLQAFATENQAELFARKKSLDMAHGTIGFRTGTPKLKTLKGFTWAAALELARRLLPFNYIRQTEELAKDVILADRSLAEVPLYNHLHDTGDFRTVPMTEALAACGMQVVQEETFFVEPKREQEAET